MILPAPPPPPPPPPKKLRFDCCCCFCCCCCCCCCFANTNHAAPSPRRPALIVVVVLLLLLLWLLILAMLLPPPDALVHRQVHELYETNSLISLEECVKKCDNMFDLTDPIDEQAFDQMCEEHCKWSVSGLWFCSTVYILLCLDVT